MFRMARCCAAFCLSRCFFIQAQRSRVHRRFAICLLGLMTMPGCTGCQTPSVETKPPEQSKASLPEQKPTAEPPVSPAFSVEKSHVDEATVPPQLVADSSTTGDGSSESSTAQRPSSTEPSNGGSASGGAGIPAPRGSTVKSGKSRQPVSAESALKTATGLRERARLATDKKQFGSAFELTTQAWEAARVHPNDPQLKQLTSELAAELESLGTRANSQAGARAAGSSTRLIEK